MKRGDVLRKCRESGLKTVQEEKMSGWGGVMMSNGLRNRYSRYDHTLLT